MITNLNEKEMRLERLLRSFHDDYYSNSPIPNEYELAVEDTIEAARRNGWTDEFIRICETNPGAEFCDIISLIHTPDRFPPLEIYDEDTGEILGYGYEGNFPDK